MFSQISLVLVLVLVLHSFLKLCQKGPCSLCFYQRKFCFSWNWVSTSAFIPSHFSLSLFFLSMSNGQERNTYFPITTVFKLSSLAACRKVYLHCNNRIYLYEEAIILFAKVSIVSGSLGPAYIFLAFSMMSYNVVQPRTFPFFQRAFKDFSSGAFLPFPHSFSLWWLFPVLFLLVLFHLHFPILLHVFL